MITNSWLRITSWAAGLVAVAAALYIIRALYEPILRPVLQVLLPISIAVVLALLLDPTIERLARRGVSRPVSVALVATLFLAAVVLAGMYLIPVLVNQASELAGNMERYFGQAQEAIGRYMASHEALLRRLHLPTTTQEIASKYSAPIQSAATKALTAAGAWLAGLLSKAIWLVLIPIITIFLVVDMDRLKAKALLLVPERHRQRTSDLAGSVGHVFGRYVRGLIAVAILYGIACGVAIALWGVPYAVVLGAAAGALSLVPYIGTISTLILVALIAYVSKPADPLHALWVAVTLLIVNQLFDNLVTPKVVGKAVGLHPALAIFALLIGAQLFGILGMILAVPVAASIQILVLEFYPPLKGPEREEKPKTPSLLARLLRRK